MAAFVGVVQSLAVSWLVLGGEVGGFVGEWEGGGKGLGWGEGLCEGLGGGIFRGAGEWSEERGRFVAWGFKLGGCWV